MHAALTLEADKASVPEQWVLQHKSGNFFRVWQRIAALHDAPMIQKRYHVWLLWPLEGAPALPSCDASVRPEREREGVDILALARK